MLKREQESILSAINVPWIALDRAEGEKYREAVAAAEMTMKSDPRYIALLDALLKCGIADPDSLAWNIARGNVASMAAWTAKGLKADIVAASRTVPKPTQVAFYGDPCYSTLNIALASSTLKWAALQTDVYILIAGLSGAKTTDEMRVVVNAFTKAITK